MTQRGTDCALRDTGRTGRIMSVQATTGSPAGVRAIRATRWVLTLCAVATPLLSAWLGVHTLALHLESLQPDGDLEAGGNFAIGVLGFELVIVNYLGSALILGGLWRWVGRNPMWVLLVVTCASLTITLAVVGLNWE